METVSTTTADGLSIYSAKPTLPRIFSKKWFLGWFSWWFPGKPTESNLCSVEELTEKVKNNMDRDHGWMWLNWMGVDPAEIKKYSPEELMAISREVQTWPRKEPETCETCGQEA